MEQAVKVAFEPAGTQAAAFVVTYKGRIIGEPLQKSITKDTPLESWSMGKSLSSTLMGILIQKGVYTLRPTAPIPQWREKDDKRINSRRISDIMHMASGLYCRAPQDPDYNLRHWAILTIYLYTRAVNSFEYAANPASAMAAKYNRADVICAASRTRNYLNRLGIEKLGEVYHTFPQQAFI
ncbi:MAG: hypothetical protein U0X91_21725 [Spirosomataceae bacterium]